MNIVIMIVSAMLILTGLVVAHEFGHYLAAKKRGIEVAEFSIGFGPRLIKWYRNGTEFSFRPILFGGFVRFTDDVEQSPKPGDFRSASLLSRFITIISGPAMNILVAFILAVIMLMSASEAQGMQISEVEDGAPAQQIGLQEGDVIKTMNGVDMLFFSSDWQEYLLSEKGDTLDMTIVRDGQEMEFSVPFEQNEEGQQTIGVLMEPHAYNFFEAIGLSFRWLGEQMGAIFNALGGLFSGGESAGEVAGIVGTVVVVGNVVQYGTAGLLIMLIAMISINLAIINLFPLPALDGGKLLMLGIEKVRKKPVSERIEGILNFCGFVFIMGLAVVLVVQDIFRLAG